MLRVRWLSAAFEEHMGISVAEFEDRTRDMVVRAESLLESVFEQAEEEHGLARDDIEVMLAGDSTRMPMIRDMIEAYTGVAPLQLGNPELLVTGLMLAYTLAGVLGAVALIDLPTAIVVIVLVGAGVAVVVRAPAATRARCPPSTTAARSWPRVRSSQTTQPSSPQPIHPAGAPSAVQRAIRSLPVSAT